MIDIQDGPGTSVDLMIKGQESGETPAMDLPIGQDTESIKQLMQMAGLNTDELNFEVEPIEGGMRINCSDEESKAKIKELLDNLFNGNLLQTLLGGLMQAFMGGKDGEGGLGDLLGQLDQPPDEDSE